MGSRTIVLALALCALGAHPGLSQPMGAESKPSSARSEVLVLGVYHMANPGSDVVNVEADDVLAPRRQAEIAELIEVLEKFEPTKIAVEKAFHDGDDLASLYNDYLTGEHRLTRNERQQIGFRLAKELEHATLYAVDADGEYPFPRLQDYAQARGHAEEFEALMDRFEQEARAWDAYLASHTVLEALLYLNSDDYAARRLASDYAMAHLGEPWNWAGPDLVSDWFRRNMRIYSNVLHLVDSPEERVLVIFGAGHLGWLRHSFATDPQVRSRKLVELAR